MLRFPIVLALTSAFFVVACGVDTTGLSPASSRVPLGSPAAPVVVQEFGDLECPACKTANTLISKPLVATYGDKIRFEFKHFPLSQHESALEASEALECAADQGKFWQFLDYAYDHQDSLSSDMLRQWGSVLGLDAALFDRCLSSGIKESVVMADQAEGVRLKINETPTYVVNGTKVADASLGGVSAAIDMALKQLEQVPL